MSTKLLYELTARHIDIDNKNYIKILIKVKYSRAKPRVTASCESVHTVIVFHDIVKQLVSQFRLKLM